LIRKTSVVFPVRYAINIKKFVPDFRQVLSLTRQALSGKEYDYTSGSIHRAVALLAIPMVLELSMESVFAITDIFFVSGLGAEAVATVGLTEAVITLLYAVAVGLSMAVTAMVARRIGEKNPEGTSVVAGQTIWIGMGVAILVGTFGMAHAENILGFMGAEAAVIAMGSDYTAIMLGGSVTIIYLFLFNAVYRGAGNPGIAMRSLWLANGINIVLDPCLIYGIGPFPEMGVTGAAIATNIGRGIGVLYQLYHLFDGSSIVRLQLRHLSLAPSVMSCLLKLSVGGISQFLIATASWVVLMRLVSGYGSTAVAGYTIAIRIIDLTILPAWGMSNAAATLVGQNLGALKPERAEQSVMKIMQYNFLFLVTVAIIFMIFAESLIGIFTQDPVIIAYGSDCLRYISYGYGLFAIGMVLIQVFNGAGDTFTPTRINLLCFWIVQIPVAFVLAEFFGLGPTGVFLAITITESLVALVAYLEFRKGNWKLKVV
jgi:putative MATE family efflux protein